MGIHYILNVVLKGVNKDDSYLSTSDEDNSDEDNSDEENILECLVRT